MTEHSQAQPFFGNIFYVPGKSDILKPPFFDDSFGIQRDHVAQTILKNSKIITEEISSRMQTLKPGQKLILGFGEIHESGTHITLLNDVLDHLTQQGVKCAVALEWPSNNIDLHVDELLKSKSFPGCTLAETIKENLSLPENAEIKDRLSSDTTPVRTSDSRLDRTILHQYMDNHNIPVFCADALRNWDLYIKNNRKKQDLLFNDPETEKALKEAAHILGESTAKSNLTAVNSAKPLGMLARNLYTINAVNKFFSAHPETEIVIIESGREHVIGNSESGAEKLAYEHSLSALFKEKSSHAFAGAPVFQSEDRKITDSPSEALNNTGIIDLEPLENRKFNIRNHPESDMEETAYIESVSKYFPWMNETLSEHSLSSLHAKRRNELFRDLQNFHNGKKTDDDTGTADDTAPAVPEINTL